ncbi:MAG: ABC transporter permease [Candidatus Thermoplasmatota archaeon]|jgi:ABC-2 type transport system permease protein|nr:ABC transporter permease [Candidatus Sysuiplasma jiujiangense]MBX8642347.1 ABC transporter permease [Candidatus Sysuiplasma jiujiangense]MCL4317323.1 ABC transporter permease [Candidatus Thermoplasmatota archaeon]
MKGDGSDGMATAGTRRGKIFPAFALVGWRWIARNPIAVAVPVLLPFFFLYFLHLISQPKYFPLEVAGAMLFTTQNIGSWCLSDAAEMRLEMKLQELFTASPLDRIRYLFGIAFSNLIPAAPALVVLGILLSFVTHVSPEAWLVLVASIFAVWILYSAVGLALASRVRSQMEVWPVGSLVFTFLGIFSPLYYPLSVLPPAWQVAAHFLPATYAALLVQGALGFTSVTVGGMLLNAALLVISTLAGLVIVLRLYTWRER